MEGRRDPKIARWLWYVGATILLLAMPMHSDWLRRNTASAPGRQDPTGGSARFLTGAVRSKADDVQVPGAGVSPFRYSGGGIVATESDQSRPQPKTRIAGDADSPRSIRARATGSAGRAELAAQRAEQPDSGAGNDLSEDRVALSEPGAVGARSAVTRVVDPQLAEALAGLEQGYQAAVSSFGNPFGGGGGVSSNPFQDALGQGGSDPDPNSDSPTSDPGEPTPTQNPEPTEPGSPDQPPPPPSGGSEPEPTPETDDGAQFSLLVTGRFGPESKSIQRALFGEDGSIITEDGTVLKFTSGVVGAPRRQFVMVEGELLAVGDVNGDGLDDVVLTRNSTVGTVIEAWLRVDSATLQLAATGFVLFDRVTSLAFFDSDALPGHEVVVTLAKNENLNFFAVIGTEVRYLRELKLRFRPALLTTTRSTVTGEERLLIFDSDLSSLRFISSKFNPNLVLPLAVQKSWFSEFELSAASRSRIVKALTIEDQLVLFRAEEDLPRTFGAFGIAKGFPLTIFGDQQNLPGWEFVYFP